MGGINMQRVLLGGFLAAVIIFVLEGVASLLYFEDLKAALEAHGLSAEMSGPGFLIPVFTTLITGFMLVFFYALARPRLGPGPKTAVIIACLLWLGGYLLSILGLGMIGLFAAKMLVLWAVIGLVEMVLAGVAGAAVYKEEPGA